MTERKDKGEQTMDERITCLECQRREPEAKTFTVGNPAKPQMGHAMFFTPDGRTALCVVAKSD